MKYKTLSTFILTLIATVSISVPAYGDQCAYISKEQALRAISVLNLKQIIYFFCEPCGDKFPQQSQIQSLSASTVGYENFWQVYINEKGIDLAYTFIESSLETKPMNLAAIARCPARDVSPVLPR